MKGKLKMKVKDLISKLEKLNPDLEVVVKHPSKNFMEDFKPLQAEDVQVIKGLNITSPITPTLFDCSPTHANRTDSEKLVSLSGDTWASKRSKE